LSLLLYIPTPPVHSHSCTFSLLLYILTPAVPVHKVCFNENKYYSKANSGIFLGKLMVVRLGENFS
jgi:hypothetical protein